MTLAMSFELCPSNIFDEIADAPAAGDIFDELDPEKKDIFDELETPGNTQAHSHDILPQQRHNQAPYRSDAARHRRAFYHLRRATKARSQRRRDFG